MAIDNDTQFTMSKLTVLLLLAVTGRLLQGLDDKRGSRWNDRNRGLTVLDGELDSDLQSFPVLSALSNIFTNLLGGLFDKKSFQNLYQFKELTT